MATINEIFRTFGPEYRERFGHSMPREHHKVITTLINCRTEETGIAFYECEKCGASHIVYQACGNRHCPTCQHHKIRQWLENHLDQQLPGHHFMITFTVPEKIRSFIRSHQRLAYSAMFRASSEAIKKLVADPRYIGGDLPGFFGVLHTWGRTLGYHPHIHYVVTGGALSSADRTWHPSRVDFYLPVKALSTIYRAKFRDEMKKASLYDHIPSTVWDCDWNVHCQAMGAHEAPLMYLAPYVFKVAISNSRIIKVEDKTVFIRYKKSHSNRFRTLALDVFEFIRRFLQHILPSGFMKIRYYGFMNHNCKIPADTIHELIELSSCSMEAHPKVKLPPWQPITCKFCGGTLRLHSLFLPSGIVVRPG